MSNDQIPQPPAYPPQQPGFPQGDPNAFVPPPAPRKNGFATAGLILGILPTGIIGLIFSIIGLVKSKTTGSGKGKSIAGLILSILWIIGGGAIVAAAVNDGVKQVVSCNTVETQVQQLGDKAQADGASDPTAYKADVQQIIDLLNTQAGKVSDKKSADDMRALAKDFQQILDDVNSGQAPDTALITKVGTDGSAVDDDCS